MGEELNKLTTLLRVGFPFLHGATSLGKTVIT